MRLKAIFNGLICAVLVASCATMEIPLPARCTQVGVAVAAEDIVSGTIVTERTVSMSEVQRQCRSPFTIRYGCTIALAPKQYELWYVDVPEVRDHERCHALYEEWNHTK